MRPRSTHAAIAVAAALAAIVRPAFAQTSTSSDEAGRVRAALARPPSKLTLLDRTPDFTVHIEKRRPMQDIFDVPPWATDPVGWQPPAVGFDLLSVVRYIARSASDAKRGRDERLAREEVQRAIGDYCAALPANDARPQICSTSPAIR